jgi:signal transduction histidine kinase
MNRPLRVLLVERSEAEAIAVLEELRRGDFEPSGRVVSDADRMREALDEEAWDVVLADLRLPRFSAREALEVLHASGKDIPLIAMGTTGEELAVEAMKAGAQDFFLRGQSRRLPAAVARELREAAVRRENRRAEEARRFLAEAGSLLASSLEYETTLHALARHVVSSLGDLCIIDVEHPIRGSLVRHAAAHRDPQQEARLRQLAEALPPRWEAGEPTVMALRQGRTVVLDGRTEDGARGSVVQIARRLGAGHVLATPIRFRDRLLGVLNVARSTPYATGDVQVLEELARRAAMAIENARLYREAQDAIQARDEFLAVASHELNTPLTVLQLQVERLQQLLAADGPVDDRMRRKAEAAARSSRRLAELVERLLDISVLSGGALPLRKESVDLRGLVEEITERHRPEATKVGSPLEVRAPGPVMARVDRVRFGKVLSNLVDNAIKFGSGKPVVIELRDEGRSATISVTDQGIGIAREDLDRIFQRLERAVPRRHYGGLGLGLFISRAIVDAHGGALDVVSTPGAGATFCVRIPLWESWSDKPIRGRAP